VGWRGSATNALIRSATSYDGCQARVSTLLTGNGPIRVTTTMGDVVTLTVHGPGESFGELAAIGEVAARTASAVAATDVETLTISRAGLDELRTRHPRVERFIVELLAQHVVRLNAHLLEALYVPVEKRVLRRLLALRDACGEGDGVALPFTQEDLASMAGTIARPCAQTASGSRDLLRDVVGNRDECPEGCAARERLYDDRAFVQSRSLRKQRSEGDFG